MLWGSVFLHIQLEVNTLEALNIITDKNTKDWSQANVGVRRKLLVH
jgi:hypothetical protein